MSDKPYKLVLSELLEKKIRTYCALSPNREWSGVLFYTFEGNFENGITIYGNDFYLMDQGSGAHTEFDLNEPEITRYMVFEGLTNNCIGLCHSHNQMKAFFSGEDASTLHQYGTAMNNFVSLVVCNAGQYVARLTRKATINGTETTVSEGTVVVPLFNTTEVETYPYKREASKQEKGSYIEYVDLDIEKPEISLSDSYIERFGEVSHKCSSEKSTFFPGPSFTKRKETVQEPTLFKYWDFDDEEELAPELLREIERIPWHKSNFKGYICQLLLGSPFAPPTVIESTELNGKYLKRFPNIVDFLFWFETWLDYIVAEFSAEKMEACLNMEFSKDYSIEDLFLGKLYIEIGRLKLKYGKDMQQTILNRIS